MERSLERRLHGAVTDLFLRTGPGFFLLFYLDGTTLDIPLETENGEPVLTESGESVLSTVSIYSLASEDIDLICSVPREWSAAHIDKVYITLIPGGGVAWGVPPTLSWGQPGLTWGQGDSPVQITC